jgi:hypothetical protein
MSVKEPAKESYGSRDSIARVRKDSVKEHWKIWLMSTKRAAFLPDEAGYELVIILSGGERLCLKEDASNKEFYTIKVLSPYATSDRK